MYPQVWILQGRRVQMQLVPAAPLGQMSEIRTRLPMECYGAEESGEDYSMACVLGQTQAGRLIKLEGGALLTGNIDQAQLELIVVSQCGR